MNIQQAELILLKLGIKVALQHRFAFDSGTILRLENYAMINIFDDGRYYIQGENTAELVVAFTETEAPWSPQMDNTGTSGFNRNKLPPPIGLNPHPRSRGSAQFGE